MTSCFNPCAVLALFLLPLSAHGAESGSVRQRLSFNSDWRFTKGDPSETTTQLDYQTLKPWLLDGSAKVGTNAPGPATPEGNPGSDVSFAQFAFDDSGWRKLNLPHDWGIEGPFKQEYPGETGKLAWWGIGWYRKHFNVPASDAGKEISLEIDGAMAYATVWLNGQFVGGWPYGYASWSIDLTAFFKPGAENVLAIRLDNPPDSSRWYPGGGIYRNVWLVKTAPLHVAHWGTFVTTPEITEGSATVELRVDVENSSSREARPKISTQIFAAGVDGHPSGGPVASLSESALTLPANSKATASLKGAIEKPRRWSLKDPQR